MQNFSTQLQWNDFRLILAVARSGSFAGAAARLGMSTPTVFRHAKEVESRFGTLVFRRDNTGVSLTSAGREAAELAARIEEEIAALEARVANEDSQAAGTIRLATVDTLLAGPLMPILNRFRQHQPAIVLRLNSSIGMADLRQREADAALRAGGAPPESLVGRRLCRIAVAVYRGRDMAEIGAETFDRQPWVVPDDELSHLASARWLKDRGYCARATLQANSLNTLAIAVANGMGLGILPCYLADGDPKLIRIGAPIDELSSDLWFLTHSEIRHTARMRALSDFLASEFHGLRGLFEGTSPG